MILFSSDNGTATVGYQPQHDPEKKVGKIGGRAMNGHKGQVLEGGSRVPLIANWKGVIPPGGSRKDLIDFTDLLPTFADLAGAKLPADVKFDGRSFAPQLRGEQGMPREWIYVQLGGNWYARNDGWKLNEQGELFRMNDAPFVEEPVATDSTEPAAVAARKELTAVLAELNPAGASWRLRGVKCRSSNAGNAACSSSSQRRLRPLRVSAHLRQSSDFWSAPHRTQPVGFHLHRNTAMKCELADSLASRSRGRARPLGQTHSGRSHAPRENARLLFRAGVF